VRADRAPRGDRDEARARSSKRDGRGAGKGARQRQPPEWETTRIYVGAGRRDRVRPSDLVGAIANEVGVGGEAVGAIQISETHSLVEIPAEIADDIIEALRATTIKGRRVVVRRDRGKG
jgi:ATP-dependent RNA helicase DeaD